MSVMVISTLLQVLARAINLNVPFTEELTIYAMMWVTLLGSVYTFGLKKQIAIEVLRSSIKPSNQWKLDLLVELIIILFAVLIPLIGGTRFVYVTFKMGQVSSVMQVAKGWIYTVLPISGLLILIYNLLNISDILKERNHVSD